MATKQGDRSLLDDPIAQELLQSMILLANSILLHCASLRARTPASSLIHPLNPFSKSVDSSHPLTNSPTVSSMLPAQLSYVWSDGSPRVITIWFHWNGQEIVLGSPPNAPKVETLEQNPKVVLTINNSTWPYKVLMIQGTAQVETIEGVVPEYASTAERYFGEAQGKTWVGQVGQMFSQMTRISGQPEWVGILDFEKRFPSAIEAAMAG